MTNERRSDEDRERFAKIISIAREVFDEEMDEPTALEVRLLLKILARLAADASSCAVCGGYGSGESARRSHFTKSRKSNGDV